MKATFTMNSYDQDGDIIDNRLTIHMDRFSISFQSRAELDAFIVNLKTISAEVAANYEPW